MPGLSERHKAWLIDHSGIDPDYAASLGWRSAEAGEIGVIIGRNVESPGIVFPYPNSGGYERVRLDHPLQQEERKVIKSKDGQETVQVKVRALRYLTPKGASNHAYILPEVEAALLDPANPIAITEGELKAAKATQDGQPTICVHGVWSWIGKSAPRLVGDKVKDTDILAELAAISWSGRNVWLFWDSDALTNDSVRQAGRYLQSELARRGASARLVVFREENGAKVGLDDYLKCHSLDDLWEYASEAILADTQRNVDIEWLKIQTSSPPSITVLLSWGVLVEGLDYQDLLEFKRFQRAVVKQTNQLPTFEVGRFGQAWETYISDILSTRAHLEAAPDEASPEGIIWGRIVTYLVSRVSQNGENLARSGAPYVKGKWTLFKPDPLGIWLRQPRFRTEIEQRDLWRLLKGHGAEPKKVRIPDWPKPVNVWRIPTAELQDSRSEEVDDDPDDEEI